MDFIMLCFVALSEIWYIAPLGQKPLIKNDDDYGKAICSSLQ